MARAGKNNQAFTILELLVAMALLGIVVTVLASILSSTQKGVAQIGSVSSQRQDARAVLDQISRDLRSTLEPASRSFELSNSGVRQPQFLLNPPGFTANGSSIFWSARNESSLGCNILVGYILRWETTGDGPLPRLCRVSFNANDTESIKQTLQGAASANSTWVDSNLIDSNAPGVQAQGYQGWISDNVLAFYARVLDPQMNPITNYARGLSGPAVNTSSQYATFASSANGSTTDGKFDSLKGYQYTRQGDNVVVNRFGSALPTAVELVIVTAPPSAIKLLPSAPAPVLSGNASAMWTDITTFISNLPEPLPKVVRTHSTIVPIAVQQ